MATEMTDLQMTKLCAEAMGIATWPGRGRPDVQEQNENLNRALVECVAKMQRAKCAP